ncbi:PAS domain-containing protein [Allocoleopsis franciscana]|uniref:histidine kinase n=1 Tax=Allocoleopsis franciscana PCC 7113 TaxID=1173027 RepID=K9WJ62_9CYAN|nr:PAS domain-containing protein [Allocoleopsis franciscana]AFZ19851.1 bacteriophytochrome (light-regulated signal transduction histidine kinase) [Allocoleopsis franciscana PCC 7113]
MDISFNPNISTSGNDFDDLQNPQSLARRLETSEARIYGLLATLPQIVWLAQINGSVTNFNPRWYEYTGLTASESLGWGFLKAIHPEDRDSLWPSYAASAVVSESVASNPGGCDPIECRIRDSDGIYRWFIGQRMPVKDTQGQILEWVAIYTLKDQPLYPINHSVGDQERGKSNISSSLKPARASSFALSSFASSSSRSNFSVCSPDPKSFGRRIELTPVLATLSQQESTLCDIPKSAQHRRRNWLNELSHTIIWETDATTEQFTFVSHSAEQVLGYPVEQWLENPDFWVNLIHPEDRQWTVAVCRKKIIQDRDYELEYRCLTADHRVVWLRDRAYMIRDEQGQVHKRRGLMVDITLAKLAEVELQARLRQQAAIAQLGQQALLRAPLSSLMDECLNLICQILGVEYCQVWEWLPDNNTLKLRAGFGWREGLVGQALIDASANTQAGYTLQSGQPVVVENLRGETRFQGSPLLHEHDICSGLSVIMGGMSLTRQEGEEELPDIALESQQEQQNSSTQDEPPTFAPALLTRTPLPSSLQRRYLPELNGATLSRQPWGVLAAHTSRQRVFSQSDVDFLQSVANVLAGAMQSQQTDAALYEATAQLAQTTAALEKRSKELDEFAYITSHDLKAPLRAIANLSQWIEEDIAHQLDAENRHQLQLLRGRVYRLEALIEGLLQYSRAGRLKSEPQEVDVGLLLKHVIDTLNPHAQFRIIIAPGMPTLMTERLPLERVFTQLIDNAIKHHPLADGTVMIGIEEQPDAYEFRVVDDGLGIAPQFHERVFGIFQTLQAKDTHENTGLGLAIAKRIVEGKGGTIRLESQEGQGATFYFTWPKVLR